MPRIPNHRLSETTVKDYRSIGTKFFTEISATMAMGNMPVQEGERNVEGCNYCQTMNTAGRTPAGRVFEACCR